jgi:hypothetical protein
MQKQHDIVISEKTGTKLYEVHLLSLPAEKGSLQLWGMEKEKRDWLKFIFKQPITDREG